jgi:hypothetical protein
MRKENFIGIATEELYRIFDCINYKYYSNQLKVPMIIIQSTKAGGRNLLNGWFTLNKVWVDKLKEENKYEITICAESLQHTLVEICETMNHEIVHYYNKISDIQDCCGKRHNKKFMKQAMNVDLECIKDSKIGYITNATPKFESFVKDIIKPDENIFNFFRQLIDEKKIAQKSSFKYECPTCGLKIRAKKDISIKCGECDIALEMEDE